MGPLACKQTLPFTLNVAKMKPADLELHELALQSGKLGILQCVMTEAEF